MNDLNLVLDNLPDPWPLRVIQPTLVAYGRGQVSEPIQYFQGPADISPRLENMILNANRVILIVHGFRSNKESRWVQDMKDALLRKADDVVAVVDWTLGADLHFWKYIYAAANTQTVSAWLARIMIRLHEVRPALYIWGVGHSLGVHLLGQTGRQCRCLNRITGLDPAGPAFELANFDIRLSPCSATDLVDVIHTDGFNWERFGKANTKIPINHFGSLTQLGTYDFYPNYGTSNQPGARSIVASHNRARDLFLWSIDNPGKYKTSCVLDGVEAFDRPVISVRRRDLEVEMGYYADRNPPNPNNYMFYLATNAEPPWVPLVGPPPPPFRRRRKPQDLLNQNV